MFTLEKLTRSNVWLWNRQILAQYDLPASNKTKLYLTETSVKVYSQDFQTVFKNKDMFGHNEVRKFICTSLFFSLLKKKVH